jgi:hypothetical protein
MTLLALIVSVIAVTTAHHVATRTRRENHADSRIVP